MKKIFSIVMIMGLFVTISVGQNAVKANDSGIQKANATVKVMENNKAESIIQANPQAAAATGIDKAAANAGAESNEAATAAPAAKKSKKACCAKSKKSCGSAKKAPGL